MHAHTMGTIALASALLGCTVGEPADGSDGSAGDDDGTDGATAGSGDATAADDDDDDDDDDDTTDADDGADTSAGDTDPSDTGDPPPPPVGGCNADGECSFPETCNTCPDECGSCDVSELPNQRARYVDLACDEPGDGFVDSCADSPGGPGRFSDLQVALDSLEPGDTLYVHPGAYYREGDAFVVSGIATEDAPIVITAAIPEDPPVIHSWDPSAPEDNSRSHLAIGGGEEQTEWIIVDNLIVEGLIIMHGDHSRIQNIECRHGWEVCDGNWSCIRLEWCTDCLVHHNYVHDVVDTTAHCTSGEFAPRESGFKEFDAERAIWEFNTVENTAQWGYDLHRSSIDPIVRYNLFRNAGPFVSIRSNRSAFQSAYGNVVLGGGKCIDYVGEDAGDGFADFIDHNTCLFGAAGIYFNPFAPATVTNNVFGGMGTPDSDNVMLVAPDAQDAAPHLVDYNAYDAGSQWSDLLYESYAETLEAWQALTGYDEHSIAAPGGACTFVDPPSDPNDLDFDLTIAEGPCADLGERGGPVGTCAVTSCVGHDCSGCGY